MKATIFVVCLLVLIVLGTIRIFSSLSYNRDIGGHLKRAADANTIELAKQELSFAIKNIEARGLTSGYTSIFYQTPDEDLGFWYQNLKASLEELNQIDPKASQLEKTNVLMKLRETLLDEGESVGVTSPQGISIYPHNTIFCVLFLITGIIVGIFVFVVLILD